MEDEVEGLACTLTLASSLPLPTPMKTTFHLWVQTQSINHQKEQNKIKL